MADYDALAAEANEVQSLVFPNFANTSENQQNPDSPLDNLNA